MPNSYCKHSYLHVEPSLCIFIALTFGSFLLLIALTFE